MGFLEEERTRVTKGIIFAAPPEGGEQLQPMTHVLAKELIPVYDKPMIYYPLSTLMLAGIREILIVSTPRNLPGFMELLGNGSRLGVSISYAEQARGEGLVGSLLVAERFIGGDPVCLILADNIFCGSLKFLRDALQFAEGATIFACRVKGPARYAGVELSRTGEVVKLVARPHGLVSPEPEAPFRLGMEQSPSRFREPSSGEKPIKRGSGYAIAGLYLYDGKAVEIARSFGALSRGGLEITDVNREYLRRRKLRVRRLDRSVRWLTVGAESELLQAGNFIHCIEERNGSKVGCIEEAAFRMGFIDAERLERLANDLPANGYRQYLFSLLDAKFGVLKLASVPPMAGRGSLLPRKKAVAGLPRSRVP